MRGANTYVHHKVVFFLCCDLSATNKIAGLGTCSSKDACLLCKRTTSSKYECNAVPSELRTQDEYLSGVSSLPLLRSIPLNNILIDTLHCLLQTIPLIVAPYLGRAGALQEGGEPGYSLFCSGMGGMGLGAQGGAMKAKLEKAGVSLQEVCDDLTRSPDGELKWDEERDEGIDDDDIIRLKFNGRDSHRWRLHTNVMALKLTRDATVHVALMDCEVDRLENELRTVCEEITAMMAEGGGERDDCLGDAGGRLLQYREEKESIEEELVRAHAHVADLRTHTQRLDTGMLHAEENTRLYNVWIGILFDRTATRADMLSFDTHFIAWYNHHSQLYGLSQKLYIHYCLDHIKRMMLHLFDTYELRLAQISTQASEHAAKLATTFVLHKSSMQHTMFVQYFHDRSAQLLHFPYTLLPPKRRADTAKCGKCGEYGHYKHNKTLCTLYEHNQ